MSESKPQMRDKRRTWQVRYDGGLLGREMGTREEAIRLACADHDQGKIVEAVLGPNFQLIDRAQLERECAKRRP
jgi:hypothetical protein